MTALLFSPRVGVGVVGVNQLVGRAVTSRHFYFDICQAACRSPFFVLQKKKIEITIAGLLGRKEGRKEGRETHNLVRSFVVLAVTTGADSNALPVVVGVL